MDGSRNGADARWLRGQQSQDDNGSNERASHDCLDHARRERAHIRRRQPGSHQQRAFGRLAARASPAVNVAFTSGDYYYLVGAFVSALTANSEAAIIAAASRLYHRVHG